MNFLKGLFIIISLFLLNTSFAQGVVPCEGAVPFCSDSTYVFNNNYGGVPADPDFTAPIGPDYDCLFNQPNPVWYFFQVGVAGPIQLTVTQIGDDGTTDDVDFAMWGPFESVEVGCEEIMTGTIEPIQCSYSGSYTETIGLGMPGGVPATTPPVGIEGEIYIVILTNYSCDPGTITFEQTAGTGETDCSILCGLSVSSNGPICQGETLILSAEETSEEGDATYLWTGPGGFTSTEPNVSLVANVAGEHTYTCTAILTFEGESDTCIEEIIVTVYPTFINEQTVEICEGDIYEWQGGIYYSTGVYTKEFKTVNGCDSIYKLDLTVNPMPDMSVATQTPYICEGDEAILALLNPNNNYSYKWLRNGVLIPDATFSSYKATEAGEYRVIGTTDRGCIDTSRLITVFVNPPAYAKIHELNINTYELCIGDTIKISADYYDNYLYRWSPEKFFRYTEGNRQSEAYAVLYEPTFIKLKTFNEYGCTAEDSVWVSPVPCCDVLLPTGFSPNGDGLNDHFNMMLQRGQVILSFQIFDRLGNMVYDNNNQLGWDGTDLNGNEVAQAVYYYRIVYSCTDEENYEKKGDITLVR